MTHQNNGAASLPEQFLTAPEAAAILGCSTRAVERKATAGAIATKNALRRGRRPATLYNAADVERIRAEMQASERGPSEMVPAALSSQPGAREAQQAGFQALVTMAEYLHLRPGGTVTPPSAQRRWLTAEEAADRSGLSVRFLRRLAKRGEVLAVRDAGDWKFEAASLDAWHPEHGLSFEAMKDIKAIAEARK